jgi:hypothetical protein
MTDLLTNVIVDEQDIIATDTDGLLMLMNMIRFQVKKKIFILNKIRVSKVYR